MSTYQAIFKFSEANYAGGYGFYFTSVLLFLVGILKLQENFIIV